MRRNRSMTVSTPMSAAYPSNGLSAVPTVGRDAELELVDHFLERVPGGTPILVIELELRQMVQSQLMAARLGHASEGR